MSETAKIQAAAGQNPVPIEEAEHNGDKKKSAPSQSQSPSQSSARSGLSKWETRKQMLLSSDMSAALSVVSALRERMEIVHSSEFPLVLRHLLPAMGSLLKTRTRANLDPTSQEHMLRHKILELVSRFPHNEALRPYALSLAKLALEVLGVQQDVEENAMLANRIYFDLQKNYRHMLDETVQPYLDICIHSYRQFPLSVQRNFTLPAAPATTPAPTATTSASASASADQKTVPAESAHTSASAPASSSKLTPPPLRSTFSFRVLTEFPLTIMMLLQCYPKYIRTTIPTLVQLMVEVLTLRGQPMGKQDPNWKLHVQRTRELVAAQVKALSFLIYLLRGYSEIMRPHEFTLAAGVIGLLQVTCHPPHMVPATRRELLVAVRHILATEYFAKAFYRHLDTLLDEQILIGSSSSSSCITTPSLRTLGYGTLADLVHHVRNRLTMTQLGHVVEIFGRVLHDTSMAGTSHHGTNSHHTTLLHFVGEESSSDDENHALKILEDISSTPWGLQVTSVRLLLNLVDHIFHNKDPNGQLGRDLLARIFNMIVYKFYSLQIHVQNLMSLQMPPSKDNYDSNTNSGAVPDIADPAKGDCSEATKSSSTTETKKEETEFDGMRYDDVANALLADRIRDVRALVKPMVLGLKTVIWCINNYRHQQEKVKASMESSTVTPDKNVGNNEEVFSASMKMTATERNLVDKYLEWCPPCLELFRDIYSSTAPEANGSSVIATVASSAKDNDYREILISFAASLTVLDSYNFRLTVGRTIPELVDQIVKDRDSMVIPRHLLTSSQSVSYDFCDIFLVYLVDQMDALSTTRQEHVTYVCTRDTPDTIDFSDADALPSEVQLPAEISSGDKSDEERASALLELFELVFHSMSLYSENEARIRRHIQVIVATCLRSATETQDGWPGNYYLLLRALFRCTSGGKFEDSYKELLPLLPTILNGLYRIYATTEEQMLRYTIIELCLTIPARLSSLLPHLPLLLRIIIPALQANSGELVNLGLRTLEFWVDNLNPGFLYPVLSQQTSVLTELMVSLTNHLRPAPYPYGLLTLRLLGKLGGKNRRFLCEPINVKVGHENGAGSPVLAIECAWKHAKVDEYIKNMNESSGEDGSKDCESPMDIEEKEMGFESRANKSPVTMECKDSDDDLFILPLPLDRAVDVLKLVASSEQLPVPSKVQSSCEDHGSIEKTSLEVISWESSEKLLTCKAETVDFQRYCIDVMEKTKSHQAAAALTVLRSSLATILEIGEGHVGTTPSNVFQLVNSGGVSDLPVTESEFDIKKKLPPLSEVEEKRNATIQRICEGLIYGSVVPSIQEEAWLLLKGLVTHLFLITVSQCMHIKRIDVCGHVCIGEPKESLNAVSTIKEDQEETESTPPVAVKQEPAILVYDNPFGSFRLSGPLTGKVSPFMVNGALVDCLCSRLQKTRDNALDIIAHLFRLSKIENPMNETLGGGAGLFFENLLNQLCSACLTMPWNLRKGALRGIEKLLDSAGRKWAMTYEDEIMKTALFVLKDSPQEISCAETEAFLFYSRICWTLYGGPNEWKESKTLIYDVLCIQSRTESPREEQMQDSADEEKERLEHATVVASEAVMANLVSELASSKHLVRFTVRHTFCQLQLAPNTKSPLELELVLKKYLSVIKKMIFSKPLRSLPLPEQVGVVEALTFIINSAPNLFTLSDPYLVAFLFELIQAFANADGELKDSNPSGVFVDKNGLVASVNEPQRPSTGISKYSSLTHASKIFLRRKCVVHGPHGTRIVVPGELPYGIQLRVSALVLFRVVIRRHTRIFFDALPSTQIGNIRPHVISLFFRSLISNPSQAVCAAYNALRDVMRLEVTNPSLSVSHTGMIPRELLQTCVKPVLLSLREYTTLTVPLLRGLSRLLSLYSSLFNKTLGDKLLDHLQKWTDPDRIIAHGRWKQGEEPLVAVAIINLFQLLPKAPHFVEPLIKTTIKLEAALPRFRTCYAYSPYRTPLARYLNKHPQYVVSFFLNEQRFKNPLYSEVFQDILKRDDTPDLRAFLGGQERTLTLLNVCFERQLGIIRAEKAMSSTSQSDTNSGPRSDAERLRMHGIRSAAMEPSQRQREIAFRQDAEVKHKKLLMMQKEERRTKELLEARLKTVDASSLAGDAQANIQNIRRQHQLAHSACELGQKEYNDAKQLYSEEIAKGGVSKDAGNDFAIQSKREMTIESLELQHQGLKLVETLMSKNTDYLKEHSDVVRTLRWLFRSKGRQLRLMHQESIPHRFHEESKLLGFIVVSYAENNPHDTDVLFDLLRIFLLPSANDFSFVRSFLNRMISDILTVKQKRHAIQRFFFLLNSAGSEDTKVLSIQFIVLPILMSEFKARKKYDSSCEVRSALELNPGEDGKVREEVTQHLDGNDVETECAEAESDQDFLLDGQLIRKFVNEALLDGVGGARHYGDKLNIELLRVLNILLEFSGEELVDHWKDLIKFSWNLLQSEDTKMKNLAYVNVCRFISVFDTPAKIILQVYSALLRSYHQESKDLVRLALDILVPALPLRLADDDFSKAMRFTRKIIYEEGNSIPQLAHIWQTIVRNSKIFVSYHHYFFSPMVSSLTRLGLPLNCPQENKSLALSIVDLILCWDGNLTEVFENSIVEHRRKRKVMSSTIQSEGSHLTKKIKLDKGISAGTGQSSIGKNLELDQTMKDTIANFLIRINLLVAESKGDASSHHSLAERAMNLFKKGLFRWSGKCTIQAVCFDKVLSTCQNEPSVFSETEPQAQNEKKVRDGKSKGKARNKASSKSNNTTKSTASSGSSVHTKSTDEVKFVSNTLLVACLDIFIAILEGASHNAFLLDNSSLVVSILRSCFARASKLEYGNIRIRLEKFLKHTFSGRRVLAEHALSNIRLLMERSILDSTFSVGHVHGAEGETTTKKAQTSSGTLEKSVPNRIGGDCSALFILRVIEHAYLTNVEFIEQFTGCLLSLAQKLAKEHLREAALNGRVTTPKMQQMGVAAFRQVQATPVLGILHQACGDSFTRGSTVASGTKKKNVDDGVSRSLKNVTELGSSFCSLVICLRLVSSSSLPYSFTESRQNLLHTISNILDTSDNIQVILTCINIIGDWLLKKGNGGPLTKKERNTFMRNINSFDSRGLPEVAAQPLSDIVSHIAVALQDVAMKEVGKTLKADVMQIATETVEFSSKPNESNQIVLDRLLVSCLMNANPSIRSLVISKYASTSLECSLLSAGTSARSSFEVLWHFLHSDFEGLSGRFWLVIFIEMMLTSSIQGSGSRLTSDCLASDFKTRDKKPTWTHESSSYWLPFPTCKDVIDVQTEADHTSTVTTNYIDFCKIICAAKTKSNVGQGGCVTAIISLAHGDVGLSKRLFQKLLSSAWDSVHHDSVRLGLVAGLERLLSHPFHAQFLKCEIKSSSVETVNSGNPRETLAVNVVKSLLRSIVRLNPMPVLDPDLLIGLAADYNAWHEVLTILEGYSDALDEATPDITVDKYKDRIIAMIRHCYEHLGESDISAVLASTLCNLPQTKRSISLDMYGYVKEALSSYTSLVYQDDTTDNDLISTASDFEVSFWEKRWIGLQKEMGQWPVISEYAEASGDSHLMMESAWKARDWEKVRSLWTTPSIMAALEGGDPQIKMSEIFLAIAEGKLAEVENLHAQTAQLCLYKWQLLPSISTGCNAHVSLMQDFHRLVELRESGQIMVETSTHASGRTYPDLKNLLSAWRQRLPNEFEPLSVWEDLFLWRSHMFSAITSNFHWSEAGMLATLHDRPWTAIQMARTARKQGMKEVALLSLNRLTDCAMDVSDAFSKLREQIMAYHNSESELERTGGLNLINTTNLSFFDDSQKGELFRLKGSFLQSLGGRSKANQAYCHAVQICPSYAKGWVSWGGLCKSLADLTAKQSETSVGSEASKDVSPSSARKVSQYLAQAMGCYLEAIQCAGDDKSRVHLAKCLWMLTKDGDSPGVLCQTLQTRGALLPSWIWLPWIPQLLSSLYRVEACAVKAILAKIVKRHPQSLYFSLRAFYLERRDIDRSQNPESSSKSQQHSKIPSAVYHSEELFSSLRGDHYTLWISLEAILDQLIVSFRPSYEEEFLQTISALLQRVESQTKHPQKDQSGEGDSVVTSFFKTISKIASKYFRTDTANTKDGKAKKTAEFRRRYKEDFEADFSIQDKEDSGVSHLSLEEVALRLNKWKNLLLVQVSAIPSHIPMQQLSSKLSLFCGEAPDLWSGACDSINSSSLLSSRDRHSESEAGQAHSSPSSSASAASRAAEAAASAVKMGAAHEGGGHCGVGSNLVEIPGQYVPNDINALDTEPRPELHAKLIRFEPTIQMIRRNDQLIRRIGMVGSDGKVYHFLLQFGIPYWTRTDERTAQLHYLTGKILGRGRMSSRRYLSVKSTAVIPIAQRLRMTADDTSDTSLDDVFHRISDIDEHDPSVFYQEEEGKLLKEKKGDNLPKDKQTELERAVKLQVFETVCKTVKSDLLLNHMRAALDGPEQLFQFRRSFTTQLAANSLMQYVFAVVERTPSKFIFNIQNGRVLAPDFRFAYDKQGFLEGNEMPFRLTRNIRKLIGPLLINGIFIPSMASMASSMSDNSDDLESALHLLLRDDIVSWYHSRSNARSDSKTQEIERQLGDRVVRNCSLVRRRYAQCAPTPESGRSEIAPIDIKVRTLVQVATSSELLCRMPLNYQGWL